MRLARFIVYIAFLLFCVLVPSLGQSSKSQAHKLAVTGKLIRVTTTGTEPSGWVIELKPVLTVEGKQVSSMEVVYPDTKKLESLEKRTVKAKGRLSTVTSTESGQHPVLSLSSIKEIKPSFWDSLAFMLEAL